MNNKSSYINHETCKKCLFCGDVCPNYLLYKNEDGLVSFKEEFDELCISCGHCMAVCPTDSINIEGFTYGENIIKTEKKTIDYDNFLSVLSLRRAVRQYKTKIPPKETIDKIIEAIEKAPVSFTPNRLEITVVGTDLIKKSLPLFIDFYAKLVKMLDNPVMKFFIKKNLDKETYLTIKEDIYPIFKYKLPIVKKENIDPIFRNAPYAIIIHAPDDTLNKTEDGLVAMTYGIISATTLGLGSCPVSLIPPAVNRDDKLKQMFGIPQQNTIISSFIVGYSKYSYKKSIKRSVKTNYIV